MGDTLLPSSPRPSTLVWGSPRACASSSHVAHCLPPSRAQVLPCSKRHVHDWTTCPYAHPGEKARRRDPRVFSYLAIPCPETKQVRNCGSQRALLVTTPVSGTG